MKKAVEGKILLSTSVFMNTFSSASKEARELTQQRRKDQEQKENRNDKI